MTPPAVRMTGISRRFGDVLANIDIDVDIARGSVHAVMGENGAGKSTLMSILFGLVAPDAGSIEIGGRPVLFSSPSDAIAAGIGMVHQHFRLFDSMTVAENVVYGAEPTRRGILDRRAAAARVSAMSQRYGLEVDPGAVVGGLSVGARQRVEILKALHRDATVLILDEPTAVLTPGEAVSLFAVLRRTAATGTTVVIVTHKIGEVLAVSDEVTVLRGGRVSGRFITGETSGTGLVRAMTGREVAEVVNSGGEPGAVVLAVEGLSVVADRAERVHSLDLEVRAGEIVGVAGVSGNGQHELVQSVLGTAQVSSGRIVLRGADVTASSVREQRDAGVAVIPEDRRGEGTAVAMTVAENLALGHHRSAPIGAARGLRRGWMSPRALRTEARRLIAAFDIRTPSETLPAGALSGGNAQKVVVARELSHRAPLLIAEQPTQGVDVGAIEAIHRRLLDYRRDGGAVLLVSHEISELLALADRIVVMYSGRVVADLPRADATTAAIGAAMAGAPHGATRLDAASDVPETRMPHSPSHSPAAEPSGGSIR